MSLKLDSSTLRELPVAMIKEISRNPQYRRLLEKHAESHPAIAEHLLRTIAA